MNQSPRPYPPSFINLLEKVLEDEDRLRTPRTEIRHNPSSASVKKESGEVSGACLRSLWYRATKVPESDPRSLTSRLQAGFGDAIHGWVLSKLAKSDRFKITPEASGTFDIDGLDHSLSYRLDGLVNYHGETGGLEIKTQQGYGLQRMMRDGGPKDSDILQVLSYFAANPLITWFSLMYLARDTAFRTEFHVYKDPETQVFMIEGVHPLSASKPIKDLSFEGSVSRWKQLEEAIKDNVAPERDYKAVFRDGKLVEKRTKNGVEYKTDWRCLYCSYKTLCWSEPNAEQFAYKVGP